MSQHHVAIRPAQPDDCELIFSFIKGLAEYEKLAHELVTTPDQLCDQIFNQGFAQVLIGELDGQPAGFALYFYNFSTFLGKPGIYLEDLYVLPALRAKGVGKALLLEIIKIARQKGCGRVEWSVLDWNEPAINFYKSLGAAPQDEWTTFRLTGAALDGGQKS